MKKLSFITGVLVCLTVFFAALGAVCGAVDQMARDAYFYGDMSRAAVAQYLSTQDEAQVTAYIGMDAAQQDEFAAQMAAFMAGKTEAQPDILNEKEQQHMRDVRDLTQAAAGMSKTHISLAAVLAVVAAWTCAKLKKRWTPRLAGVLSAVTVIMVLVQNIVSQIAGGGFETLFVQMHELIFTNDLWLMDPAADILIRMMPQTLFEQALLNGASHALRMFIVVLLMLALVHLMVERMVRRHVVKGE